MIYLTLTSLAIISLLEIYITAEAILWGIILTLVTLVLHQVLFGYIYHELRAAIISNIIFAESNINDTLIFNRATTLEFPTDE
jgi:hypothetical protein